MAKNKKTYDEASIKKAARVFAGITLVIAAAYLGYAILSAYWNKKPVDVTGVVSANQEKPGSSRKTYMGCQEQRCLITEEALTGPEEWSRVIPLPQNYGPLLKPNDPGVVIQVRVYGQIGCNDPNPDQWIYTVNFAQEITLNGVKIEQQSAWFGPPVRCIQVKALDAQGTGKNFTAYAVRNSS